MKKKPFYITLGIIIFIQILLLFQGFDVCDDGFALTFYQQFYNDPSSVEYNFVYWLSGLVGGIWYQLYPNGGILWFKVLALLINTATFTIAFKILRSYINHSYLLASLSVVLFANDFGFLVFYNNHLTSLLSVLGIYFLYNGITKEKSWFILISGVLVGLNVFSRLPNVSQLALLAVIPLWYYFNSYSLKMALRPIFIFVLGVIGGMAFVYLLLIGFGQFEIMKDAVSSVFSLGTASDSGHNIESLLRGYLNNYIKIGKYASVFIACLASYVFLVFKYKRHHFINYSLKLIGLILVALWIKKGGIHSLYAASYIGVFCVLFFEKDYKELRFLSALALILQFLLPMGSGGGIKSSGYMAIWLSFPLFVYILLNASSLFSHYLKQSKFKDVFQIELKSLIILYLVIFCGLKSFSISQNAYFDSGPRWLKTSHIESELAFGVHTTLERADIVNNGLNHLKEYVKPNDYLLAYDKIPMFHFLTQSRPYAYNSWPWIYDSESFKKQLLRAEENIDVLPIIIQQKFETIFEFSEPVSDYMVANKENNNYFNNARTEVMNTFIERHNYEVVWSNDFFNIYKAQESAN